MSAHREQGIYPSLLTDDDLRKIPQDFKLTVWLRPEGERWAAVALPFDIAASGESPDPAMRSLLELVEEYLISGFAEGCSFSDLRRPVPRRVWFKAYLGSLRDSRRPPSKNGGVGAETAAPRSLLREDFFRRPQHSIA